jgi:hypothetical protein
MNKNSTRNRQNSFFQEMDYLCIGGGVFLLFLILGYYDFRMHDGAVYNEGQSVYAALSRGVDYKAVYSYGAALWGGLGEFLKIPIAYPPLVTILFLPLNLFPVNVAYQLFVLLLMLCGAATVYISLAIKRHPLTALSRIKLSLLICAILFFTYPFNFSFERGNCDIIAAVFAAGALLATARGKKWPAILLLTLSSQIKVYPAILSVFLLARFGWGSFTIFIFLNTFYLFILGPNALLGFIKEARRLSISVFSWPGNHSFHSYVVNLCKAGFFSRSVAEHILALAYFLSTASFIALSLKYIKSLPWRMNNKELLPRSFGPREIGLIGVSFCLMSLLSPTSHDYKLVIHIVPYIILLNTIKGELFENEIESRFFIAVVSVFTAYLFIPRYTVMPLQFLFNAPPVMEMKTPALVFLFLSYAYLAIRGHESDCKALSSVSPPDPR